MRVFANLDEAIPEIRRDLSKAPTLASTRVQNELQQNVLTQEAQNYGYTILPDGIPVSMVSLAEKLGTHFPEMAGQWLDGHAFVDWVERQLQERLRPLESLWDRTNFSSDEHHPVLGKLVEGEQQSYYYGDRLIGAAATMVNTIASSPDSRRAYWPIYNEVDARRSALFTRIPCSLGYQVMIREVPGSGPHLHLTYLSRSCDFEKYWLTDIFFANAFQRKVWGLLRKHPSRLFVDLKLGSTSHFILSLHRFAKEGEELF